MAEFDILKDFVYGDLNPITPKGGKVFREGQTSGIEVIRSLAADSFSTETILGTGPYKAICLRVETAQDGGSATSVGQSSNTWLSRLYNAFGAGSKPTKKFVEVKASIPEIHGAMYPIPKSYDDHAAINRYPTFVARQASTIDGIPEPGEIIWVDFGNRITLEDPQYLGKIESDAQDRLAAVSANGAFDCGKLGMGGPSGDPIKTTSEPVSKIGPTIAPDYKSIDIEKERGKIPNGKGLFLGASLNPMKLTKHPIKKAKDAGISWVSIYVYKIKKNGEERVRNIESIKNFIKEFHKHGIRCYIYGWAAIGAGKGYNESSFKKKHAGQEPEDMFIKNLINIATQTGALGIQIDAEEDCWAKGTSQEVEGKWLYDTSVVKRNEEFARKLKEQCKKYRLSLGYTSTTPAKWSAKSGHYFKPWGKYCDYAIPQVYSGSGFWGPKHWKKGYERYLKEGFTNIIPGLGAYDVKGKGAKLPDRMRWEAHQCYNQGLGWSDAVIWWDWPHLNSRNRWSVVKELGSSKADTASTSTGASTTATSVAALGPSVSETPKTEEKSKSAEAIRDKKPSLVRRFTGKMKELASVSKDRDFSKKPITNEELYAFTEESPEEIQRLITLHGPSAQSSPGAQDSQKFETLKSEAKDKITNILKKESKETQMTLLENEIKGIKKQIKLIDVTGTTTPELATLKTQLRKKEKRLKEIVSETKKISSPTQTTSPPCGTRGRVGGTSGPLGATIPMARFTGGTYSRALADELAVKLPSRKRKMGVNQIMIHQSGVHTVKGTVKVLAKKGLSVHFTIGLDGKVRQHVPLEEVSFHALTAPGEQNERSIGIEMVNRYIPDKAKYSIGKQTILVNPIMTRGWGLSKDGKGILPPTSYRGNEGRIRMPTQVACEACWQLCKWLPSQISTLKLAFPGLTSKGFLWTGGNSMHTEKRFDDGIVSHGRAHTSRADGLFTEHYMVCRSLGSDPTTAYKRTIAAATWTKPTRPRANRAYTKFHKGFLYKAVYAAAVVNPNAKTFELGKRKK